MRSIYSKWLNLGNIKNKCSGIMLKWDISKYVLVFILMRQLLILTAVSISLYDGFILVLVGPIVFLVTIEYELDAIIVKRKEHIISQFREFIIMFEFKVLGGTSVESSIEKSYEDLMNFGSYNGLFMKSLKLIINKINLNADAEASFNEFAKEYEIEEIKDFCVVLHYGKIYGGDFSDITKNTLKIIDNKINEKKKFVSFISKKNLEYRLMNLLPFLVLISLNIMYREYLYVLYENVVGRIFMSVCAIFFAISMVIYVKVLEGVDKN